MLDAIARFLSRVSQSAETRTLLPNSAKYPASGSQRGVTRHHSALGIRLKSDSLFSLFASLIRSVNRMPLFISLFYMRNFSRLFNFTIQPANHFTNHPTTSPTHPPRFTDATHPEGDDDTHSQRFGGNAVASGEKHASVLASVIRAAHITIYSVVYSIVLALSLTLGMASTAHAQQPVTATLTANATELEPGDNVTFTLTIPSSPGFLVGFDLDFTGSIDEVNYPDTNNNRRTRSRGAGNLPTLQTAFRSDAGSATTLTINVKTSSAGTSPVVITVTSQLNHVITPSPSTLTVPFASALDLTPATVTLSEATAASQAFGVTLPQAQASMTTVTVTATGADARRYTISPTSFDVPANTASVSNAFTVTAVNDGVFDGDANLTVTATASVGGSEFTDSSVVTLDDDETQRPLLTLTCPDPFYAGQTVDCTVTRTRSEFASAETVRFSNNHLTLATVMFPAGAQDTLTVRPVVSGSAAGMNARIRMTATNADVTPAELSRNPVLAFGVTLPGTPEVDEGDSLVIPLGLPVAQASDVVVNFRTEGTGNAAVAGSGNDYTLSAGTAASGNYSGTATIRAGDTNVNITVTANNNAIHEGGTNRQFKIFANASVTGFGTVTGEETVTIDDNDGVPSIGLSAPTGAGVDQNVTVTLSVTNNIQSRNAFKTELSGSGWNALYGVTNEVTQTGGALTFDVQFPALSNTATFTAESQSSNSTLSISLAPSSASPSAYDRASGQDSAMIAVTQFGATLPATPMVAEGGSGTIALGITAAQSSPVTVTWVTSDAGRDGPLAANEAVAGTDYTITGGSLSGGQYSGTATIAAGDTNVNLTVAAIQNNIYEGNNRDFNLNITASVGGTDYEAMTRVELADDETVLEFGISAPANAGAGRNTTVTINNIGGQMPRFTTPVDFVASGAAVVYRNGTAVSDPDSFEIHYPALSSGPHTFQVQAEEGAAASNITVTLNTRGTSYTRASGQITANIGVQEAALVVDVATLNEGASALVTVSAVPTPAAGSPIAITYSTSDGTAMAGTDYTAISGGSGMITNTANATFMLTADANNAYQGGTNLNFSLEVAGTVLGTALTETTTVEIVDGNVAPVITLTGPTVTGTGGTTRYTLTRTGADFASDTMVTVDITGGVSGTAAPETVTFMPGESTKTFEVTAGSDASNDITLTVDASTDYTIGGTNPLRVDVLTAAINVVVAELTEGGTATATVTAVPTPAAGSPISMTYSTSDGTAEAGTDYTANSGTISVGSSGATITLTARNNDIYERGENLKFNLQVNGTVSSNPLSTDTEVTILDNDNVAGNLPEIEYGTLPPFFFNAQNYTIPINLRGNIRTREDTLILVSIQGSVEALYDSDGNAITLVQKGQGLRDANVTLKAGEASTSFTLETTASGDTNPTLFLSVNDDKTPAGYEVHDPNSNDAEQIVQLVDFSISWNSTTHIITEDDNNSNPATLTLAESFADAVSVTYTYTDGTATQATHYRTGGRLGGTFPADTSGTPGTLTLPFSGMDDMIDRANATFNVTARATHGTGATQRSTEAVLEVTVVDTDAKPNIEIVGPGGTQAMNIVEGQTATYTLRSQNNIEFEGASNIVNVRFGGGVEEVTTAGGMNLGGTTGGNSVGRNIPFPAGTTSTTFDVEASRTNSATITTLVQTDAIHGQGSDNYTQASSTAISRDIRQLGITLAADDTTPDEGDTVTLTVGLESAQPVPVIVRVQTMDGLARDGELYTAVDEMVTFMPNETTKSVTVNTMSDGVYRTGARSFNVRATATIESEAQAAQVTINVANADPLPVVNLTGPTGVLAGENATYTLTYPNSLFGASAALRLRVRGNAVEHIYNVDGAISEGMAVSNTSNSTDVNHDTGDTMSDTFVVQTRSGLSGPDPIIVDLLENAAVYSRGTSTSVTTTVTDTGIAFTESVKDIDEGAMDSVTISLNSPQTTATTINYRIEGENAIAGEEFTAMNGSVMVPAGMTTATIPVTILDDNVSFSTVNTTTRTLRVFARATIQMATTEASIQVRIREKDPLPNLELVGPATTRPGETVTFTIRNTNNIVAGTSLSLTVDVNGSFTELRAGTNTVTPMDTSDPRVNVSVTLGERASMTTFAVDVTDARGLNNITATITSHAGDHTRTNDEVHVEVREVGINFDAATVEVAEPSGASRVLTLNLTRIAEPLDVRQVTIVTEDASALAGVHYTPVNTVIAYGNNENTIEVPITILDNLVDQTSASPSPGFWVNATTTLETNEEFRARVRVNITADNDEAPTLAINPPRRIAPGRNGTVMIESNRTVSDSDQTLMIEVNGSFDFIYNGTNTITATPVRVAQGVASNTFGVTLPAMQQATSFIVQASPRVAGVNLTPITVGFAGNQPAGTNVVLPTVTQNVSIPIRAGFNVGALTETILPQIAVGLLDEVTGAISARTHQAFGDASDGGWLPPFPRGGNAGFTINGQSLADYAKNFARSEAAREAAENPWDDPTSRRLTELPSVNSLALTLRQGESSGSVGVWAEGFTRNIDGTQNGIKFDGEIPGAVLGVDARLTPNLLAGIGFSQATGDFGYTIAVEGEEDERGTYEADLTGFHPYIGYRTETGGNVWASLGIGEGEVTIAQRNNPDTYVGEVEFQNYGLGFTSLGDSRLDGSESIALNIHGDINFATIEESPTARTRASFPGAGTNELSVGRTRIGATVSKDTQLAGGGSFRQSLDLALRHDSGDIAEGGAIELGGALGLQAASGLSLDLSARTLLSHEESIDDWGIKGGLRWTSRAFSGVGRGLQLVLQPEWGNSASQSDQLLNGGIEGIAGYTPTTATDSDEADSTTTRYNFDVRYGIAIFREGLLTPFVKGDANDADTTQYGSAFSFGDFEAGASSAIGEDNAFIRYQRDF